MSGLRLSALLCSRLCHDLISPVGAVNNGIEILGDEDDPSMRAQATDLIAQSAIEAARRLMFFRMAFGAGGGMAEQIRLDEAKKATEGLFLKGRTKLDWPAPADPAAALGKTAAKLLLNLVLVGSATLPKGGTLAVRVAPDGGATRLSVETCGPNARLAGELRAALTSGVDDAILDSHNVVAQLAQILAGEIGTRVEVAEGPDRVELGARIGP